MEPARRTKQLGFGWSIEEHRERDAVITQVCLPNSMIGRDKTVSKSTVMLLLYRLNENSCGKADCCTTQDVLAVEMGCDRKTVGRALDAAIRLELLKVKKRRSRESVIVCNHYTIEWETLQRLGVRKDHPETLLEQGDTMPQRSEEHRDPSRGASGHSDPSVGTLGPERRDTVTQDNGVVIEGCKSKNQPPPSARRSDGGCVLNFRWGRTIDPSELRKREQIDDLFQIAIQQGAAEATGTDRLAFFALVIYVLRQEPPEGKPANHVGLLTNLLAGRHAHAGTGSRDWRTRPQNCDEDTALHVLAKLDRDAEPAEKPAKVETAEQSRERQIRELQESSR